MLKFLCRLALAMAVVVPGFSVARAQEALDTSISYIGHLQSRLPPLSLVEPVLADEGLQGARLGIADNVTTGQFLGQNYALIEHLVEVDGDVRSVFGAALQAGERLFIADLAVEDLNSILPLAADANALIFNSRAAEDDLRRTSCQAQIFHITPSYAMRADALAQYLMWKRWDQWALIVGSHEEDDRFAEAIRRAAKRYGAEIVEERVFEDTGGARRSDGGHVQVQAQMPVFTQNLPDHDVVVTADVADVFAEHLPYTTWDARPVVGSVGLVPTSWSRAQEQWGGTQIQRRFEAFAGRVMQPRDFDAWLAARVIGEAVTRTSANDPQTIHDYLVSDDFEIAAFKGEALTFRRWNQQLRQPVLLATPRMLVSVSPQDGYLHERSQLDTLGFDVNESDCALNPS